MVTLDEHVISDGFFRDGVDVTVPAPSGAHRLEVAVRRGAEGDAWDRREYQLGIYGNPRHGSASWRVDLSYSLLTGQFAKRLRLRRLR